MKRTVLNQWRIKKGWKDASDSIRALEKTVLLVQYNYKKNLPKEQLYEVVIKNFNICYSILQTIPMIPQDIAHDIIKMSESIIDNAFKEDNFEDFEEMLDIYLIIGRSPMKDAFDIYDKLHSMELMYDGVVKDFELELRRIGINIDGKE